MRLGTRAAAPVAPRRGKRSRDRRCDGRPRWPDRLPGRKRSTVRERAVPVAIVFTLSDSQQELQANAKAFAEGVLRPIVETIDRAAGGWESFLAGREAYR